MTIHREGYKTIAIGALAFALINLCSFYFISAHEAWLSGLIFLVTLGLLLFLISFFRVPSRRLSTGDNLVICPADGKVVSSKKWWMQSISGIKGCRSPSS